MNDTVTMYDVLTYDPETGEYTPQDGIDGVAVDIHGVRRALRELRKRGYSCEYSSCDGSGDPSVLVERVL